MATFKSLILTCLLVFCGSLYAEMWLKDNQGQDVAFSTLKGKWVFVNYWASWCSGCVEEIPELNRFSMQNKNVAIYAVNYDGLSERKQKSLIKQFKIKYPSLLRDPGEELNLGDISAIPATFVFNPQGKLVKRLFGSQTAKSLAKIIS